MNSSSRLSNTASAKPPHPNAGQGGATRSTGIRGRTYEHTGIRALKA